MIRKAPSLPSQAPAGRSFSMPELPSFSVPALPSFYAPALPSFSVPSFSSPAAPDASTPTPPAVDRPKSPSKASAPPATLENSVSKFSDFAAPQTATPKQPSADAPKQGLNLEKDFGIQRAGPSTRSIFDSPPAARAPPAARVERPPAVLPDVRPAQQTSAAPVEPPKITQQQGMDEVLAERARAKVGCGWHVRNQMMPCHALRDDTICVLCRPSRLQSRLLPNSSRRQRGRQLGEGRCPCGLPRWLSSLDSVPLLLLSRCMPARPMQLREPQADSLSRFPSTSLVW